MRSPVQNMVLATLPLLALVACQDPDVGQECTITWGTAEAKPDACCHEPKDDPPACLATGSDSGISCFTITADLFESGNTECENLACIMSLAGHGSDYDRGPAKGYCSKPCVSDNDCFHSDTGLVCRHVVLDPVFIAQLPEDLKQRYLGEIQFSSYCAVPQ